MKICNCGSGKGSYWEYDAMGIPLTRVCPNCKAEKLSKYRPEVLSNAHYSLVEPIGPMENDPDSFFYDPWAS